MAATAIMARIPKTPTGAVRSFQPPSKRRALWFNLSWNRLNALISFVIIVLLASPNSRDERIAFEPGERLPEPFAAPFNLTIVDEPALEERTDQVNRLQFFRVDPVVYERSYERLDEVIETARQARDSQSEEPLEDSAGLAGLARALEDLGYAPELARQDAQALIRRGMSEKLANELRNALTELYERRGTAASSVLESLRAHAADDTVVWTTDAALPRQQYEAGSILAAPGDLRSHLQRYISSWITGDFELRALAQRLLEAVAEPVIVPDPAARSEALQAVRADMPRKTFLKGDVVFGAGSVMGDEEERILGAFEDRQRVYQAVTTTGIAAFVALLFTLILLYLKKFPSEMPTAPSSAILISLPTIFAFALWRVLGQFDMPDLAGYGFPAALVGMLGVVLLGPRFSWLLVTCAGLLFGVASNFDFTYALVALFGGFTAITTLYTTRTRWDILTSAGIVSLVNAVVILAISFILEPAELSRETARAVIYGVTNGLVCGALVFPMLWLFERLFGVVTDFALLELTGTAHPIMRELEEKAPGSYQHTLNVTKLAEAAAREIGANYLLVRAGGYFHDIGKVEKPRYFSENQLNQEDRSLHAKLSPYMSTLVIKNHVKEGIELASKARGRYKVPREVIAFIPEHQGTALISYFYRQALKQFQESESTDPVHEDDFRYPGPKPQSIETAIVMLADSVEATVTSVFTGSNVNEDELRRVVRKSINEKFDDGQFDECDLTLRDLHLISESFVKTLLGRFHHRVQYPDAPKSPGGAQAPSGVRRVGAPVAPGKPEPVAGR